MKCFPMSKWQWISSKVIILITKKAAVCPYHASARASYSWSKAEQRLLIFFTAAKQVGLLEKWLSFICCTVDLVGSFNAMKLLLENVLRKSQWASYNCVQVWQACVLKSSIHQKDFLTTHLLSNIFVWHGFVLGFFCLNRCTYLCKMSQ